MQLHGLRGFRLSNGRPGLCIAVWLLVKVCGRGLSLRPIGWTPALSVTQKRHCRYCMRLVSYPFTFACLGLWAHRWYKLQSMLKHGQCDVRQTCGYLPSRRASLFLRQWQIILLGDTATNVCVNKLTKVAFQDAAAGIELWISSCKSNIEPCNIR